MNKEELARKLKIAKGTIYNWEKNRPELIEIIKKGLDCEKLQQNQNSNNNINIENSQIMIGDGALLEDYHKLSELGKEEAKLEIKKILIREKKEMNK